MFRTGPEEAWEDLPQSANVDLPSGELLIEGAGGGGFGDPFERPAGLVAADVRDGRVSLESARRDYGVAIHPATLRVEEGETEKLRRRA